jgi:hypothetical protein
LVKPFKVQLNGPAVQVQLWPPGDAVTTYEVIADVPAEAGADQLITALKSPGFIPVIDGASGESPYVTAFGSVTSPAIVFTVIPTEPPAGFDGLMKLSVVPSVLSVQSSTAVDPTDTPVTPTKNEPLRVIEAPPVFGTWFRLTPLIVGD